MRDGFNYSLKAKTITLATFFDVVELSSPDETFLFRPIYMF